MRRQPNNYSIAQSFPPVPIYCLFVFYQFKFSCITCYNYMFTCGMSREVRTVILHF